MVDSSEMSDVETTRAWGHAHIRRGWAVFLLSTDGPEGKKPFAACLRCSPRGGTCRDGSSCECLLCHSFYGATKDPARFDEMLRRYPGGYLAVRTGTRGSRGEDGSHLLVIDAEANVDERHGVTGLEVLDSWEEWTHGVSLPETLTARTVSGGRHLYYHVPANTRVIHSSGGILPRVDVKAEGGLVAAVGSRSGKRTWVDPDVPVRDAPSDLLEWLGKRHGTSRTGGSGGERPAGYDFRTFESAGCPDGHRDYFFNELLFRLRKADTPLTRATEIAYDHWTQVAQPPLARTHCEWWHIEYKIERVWGDVVPDVDVAAAATLRDRWLDTQAAEVRIGRKTIVRRRGVR